MAWYSQNDNRWKSMIQGIRGIYTIGDIGCFITAFCNLLRRFGKDINPGDMNRIFTQRGIFIDADDGIRDDCGWETITAYDGQVRVRPGSVGKGWPQSNNAIVKFWYQSKQKPWIYPGGVKKVNMVTHFALVENWQAGTIIDSWDGQIRSYKGYGEPVAHAIYDNVVPQPVTPPLAPGPKPPAQPSLAQPPAGPPPIKPPVYTELTEPRKMHVVHKDGANLWRFKDAQKFSDCKSVQRVPFETNVEIHMEALTDFPPNGAKYLMQADMVDPEGKPIDGVGFSWADLKDGWIEKPAEAVPEAPKIENLAPLKPAPTAATPEPERIEVNKWKATYQPIPGGPKTFLYRENMTVHDYDNKRSPRLVYKDNGVTIAGTFAKDGMLYGRPKGSVEADVPAWFGIPMDKIVLEADYFAELARISLAEKQAVAAQRGEKAKLDAQERKTVIAHLVRRLGNSFVEFVRNAGNKK